MFTQKSGMKLRKNILIVDNNCELEQLVREPLMSQLKDSEVSPILVRAKDGAEAAIKSENQKFDLVLLDTDVPRLMDGGFVYGILSYKNTQNASLIVISTREMADLPDSLKNSKIFKRPVHPDDIIQAMIQVLNTQPSAEQESKGSPSPSPTKHAVDVRVINAVITATLSVLKQFGVDSVKMEKAATHSPYEPLPGEVSSIVDITSNSFHGILCISFDKPCYLDVVSTMLMEEQSELTPDNQDAVGEINNIIFGNAKSEITNFGVKLTVPKVVIGKEQIPPCPAGTAGMMIPFSTNKGKFYIFVAAFPGTGTLAA